jgi:hypothetical protein
LKKSNTKAMKQERLKRLIKALYHFRNVLMLKNETDRAFKYKSKSKVLTEIDEIIDKRLEEFYSFRVN